ncbi:hypothetical protein AOT31_09970 [Corynebacterium ulcerans]|nr:hypothetical protein [Corynebacterium ulcerans]KPJ23589.1 hypothetical protein AOT31_09970 [Corynebacterium ulcerans]
MGRNQRGFWGSRIASTDKDVTVKAQTLGVQTMAFLDICAAKADSRPLSTIAVLSFPVVHRRAIWESAPPAWASVPLAWMQR